MIRQFGPPILFLTLSAADVHWQELLGHLLQKERGEVVFSLEVHSLRVAERRHFNQRIRLLFNRFKKTGIFGYYTVSGISI